MGWRYLRCWTWLFALGTTNPELLRWQGKRISGWHFLDAGPFVDDVVEVLGSIAVPRCPVMFGSAH
jgi:hypothetical protein